MAERDWEYRRAFFVDQALLQMDEVFLHCEMLDTLCEVFVNGILAGRGKNMHLRYDFSVKQYLREGENEVRIVFFSPLQFLREEEKREHVPGCPQSVPGVPHIRKAHWPVWWMGPTIPISGITRDISLHGYQTARVRECQIRQNHHDGVVDLTVAARAEAAGDATDQALSFVFTLLSPAGEELGRKTAAGPKAECAFTVENPQLWWTNDLYQRGNPAALYRENGSFAQLAQGRRSTPIRSAYGLAHHRAQTGKRISGAQLPVCVKRRRRCSPKAAIISRWIPSSPARAMIKRGNCSRIAGMRI